MLRKCVEKLPSVTVLTITFEWLGIFGHGLNILESKHSKLEFEHKFCIFSMEIMSYCHLNMSVRVSGNTESNYVPMEGRQN